MSFEKYDLSKLENVHSTFNGILARCPICAQEGGSGNGGGDSKGSHLIIFKDGRFGCAKYQGDKEHSRKIYNYLYRGEDFEIEEQEEFIYRGTKLKYYPEELLAKLIPDYTYWLNRGIPQNILSQFDGGMASSDEKGKLQNRYVFAVRDKADKIVGWAGRLVDYSDFAPKWKIIGAKKSFIFPARSLSEKSIKESKICVLIESIGDCLKLFEHGIENTKVMFGVRPSSQLIGYLISLGVKTVVISTNNDSAKNNVGNDAAIRIKNQLSHYFNIDNIHIILPRSKDFGESTEDEILEFKKKLEDLQNGDKVE